MPDTANGAGRANQLDGLRALAVGAVLISHYGPEGSGAYSAAAGAGVKLFFVLSGFLITGILLRGRDAVEAGRQTRAAALVRFYARRFLRIFPLYYFVIAVAFALDVEPVRRLIWRLLTYTFNIHMARQGWYEANFAHFWTLSVEEQFYVVWPWVVLVSPRLFLVPLGILMVAVGPLYRLSYILSGYQNMTPLSTYISTWTCLDSLGMGALLAIARRSAHWQLIARGLGGFGLPMALVTLAGVLTIGGPNAHLLWFDLAQAVVFCWVVSKATTGFHGIVGGILASTPLVYVGQISYGVYVYHPFMPDIYRLVALRMGWPIVQSTWILGAISIAMTLLVASLSWRLFEAPINGLKRRFQDPEAPVREAARVSHMAEPALAGHSGSHL